MSNQRITIIGTVHVDSNSIEKVRQTIRSIKPEAVAVELCPHRYEAMRKAGEANARFKIGSTGWLIYLLEKSVGETLQVFPGSEMLAAVDEAEKIGAKVALIDQPIWLTMSKIAKIPFREKMMMRLSLFVAIIFFLLPGKGKLDALPNLEELLREFQARFPSLYKILLEDRNVYMSNVLTKILAQTSGDIVAVVGLGHVSGLKNILKGNVKGSM